jgi:uncharacterized membrane protein YecN with MAPEG domain
METRKGYGSIKRMAFVIIAYCILLAGLVYIIGYFALCGRCVDGPDRFSSTPSQVRVRGYQWGWCEKLFMPAARIETLLIGYQVALVADPDWFPSSWMNPGH